MRMHQRKGLCALAIVVILLGAMGGARAQDIQDTVESGWKSLQEGRLADARAAFQSLLDADPAYDFGWYALGHVAMKERNYDEAIEHFKKARELRAEKFEYYYGLAAAFRSTKEYAKAVATLNNGEQYAADKQNQYYLHRERGFSYQSLRQYERAAADLTKAVAIQPGDFNTEQRLGVALTKLHEYPAAVEHLKKAAARNAEDYITQFYLARSLLNMALQEPDKAKKTTYYTEATRAAKVANTSRPGFDPQNLLARAYLGAQQYDRAVPAFQAVLALKPDFCPARSNLGQAYVSQQMWQPASEILEQATQCNPKSPLVWSLLGFSHTKQGNRDEALAAYGTSYGIKPDPKIQEYMDRVKKNIEIALENDAIDAFNQEQLAALDREKAAYERQKADFEEQQRRLEKYEKETGDN